MSNASIDPNRVATIVREVLERVKQHGPETAERPPLGSLSNVVSVSSILAAAKNGEQEIQTTAKTIVTPAARDEAKQRGIAIIRVTPTPPSAPASLRKLESLGTVTDSENPARATAVCEQLARRGIRGSSSISVILSETPAKDVYRICSGGRRAAAVSSIATIERIEKELSPQVWVLDMHALNFIAAVNVAARLLQ
ncbi:hypothetical protein Pla52o_48920 [Novipirellula galeiformis]|uniref:Uncharacterized protein n=1 Tax=Novipirellula galeiformis TaxID=2528004 RepID=A0A5C6C127_9BACT|nr:hypothetical protein [Novipirellula galeiformis]TWU17677.1 hypothetical protein Pla52o_48920 [Novipirellula galeiformis]